MKFRKAQYADLEEMMDVYDKARTFMKENGNPTQWHAQYPSVEMIACDIEKGVSYVCEERGRIRAVFAFIVGEDPTYKVIEEGGWINEEPYGTIHRLASDGSIKGVAGECICFCETCCDNLRADTHEDNKIMRHLLEKHGFIHCGKIYAGDGTPRIAYQKTVDRYQEKG